MKMNASLDPISTFFPSYEEREDAFRRAVGFKLARRYAGPSVFWQDFSRISRGGLDSQEKGHVAYIPSNPRDCLAFGTPHQVLMASHLSAGKTGDAAINGLLETARRFEISDLLSQPIRTLSGGETVKLALAKTVVGLATCSELVVASPFTWLSDSNRHLLESLVVEFRENQKPLSILALQGEADLSLIDPSDPLQAPSPETLPFTLELKNVRIPLTISLRPLAAEAEYAVIENRCADLLSPCLIIGDNGQGKSLLARTLAKAIPVKGTVVIGGPASKRPPCLLFQDVLTQTMLRSFSAILATRGRHQTEQTREYYQELQRHYSEALDQVHLEPGQLIGDWDCARHTLLDIKTILVAARLATNPAALILDEPDWGLSRTSAVAFVSAVMASAHRNNTPVFLISHKPWWRSITGSTIQVSRTEFNGKRKASAPVFMIDLKMEEGPT